MSDLVRNPEHRFSRVAALMIKRMVMKLRSYRAFKKIFLPGNGEFSVFENAKIYPSSRPKKGFCNGK